MPACRRLLVRKRLEISATIALLSLGLSAPASAGETALDRYLAKPDPSYSWQLVSHQRQHDATTFVIALRSQTWRSADEVKKPVWTHWLTLVRPDQARAGTAFLFIGGGSDRDPQPTKASQRVVDLALGTKTVVAEITNVPNQPLAFADSIRHGRSEDDLVAYSRVKFMITGDEEWLVRLAMVKSGIRAMDCIEEFLASADGGKLKVDKFVVAGGSKRGWTTWLIGATDPRVVAIVPLVIDALNSEAITRHHFEAYGFFSSALKDYVHHGLFPYRVGTPEYQKVLAIEDPYNYRDRPRLQIPKYLINAAGDQFFLPDNSQFYFAELPPEKHLRYVPNAKHNLKHSDALESLQAFYQAVIDGHPRPTYSWQKQADGSLTVSSQDRPLEVSLWQATNRHARDFRLDLIGKAWHSSPLEPDSQGVYLGRVAPPKSGFTAFFVELVYDSGGKYPFKFTTGVSVVPDVLPYKWSTAATTKARRDYLDILDAPFVF
jgi:PhoPQ-activated pathogenicity-related protein